MDNGSKGLFSEQPLRALIVDDDPQIVFATVRVLKQAGYDTIEAYSGREALDLAVRERPELILLDRVLPDMDGLEVCRKLKSMPLVADAFIVLASGVKISEADMSEALYSCADGYIARPIGNKELLARIDSFARIIRRGDNLRGRAEAMVGGPPAVAELSPDQIRDLVHELQVHQVELEIQNEELRRAQMGLELSRDRYAHLYNQAPVGYATLDEVGIIREANNTLGEMLGLSLAEMRGTPFSKFIAAEDRDVFLGRFKAFLHAPDGKIMDIKMVSQVRNCFYVALQGRLSRQNEPDFTGSAGSQQLQIALVDITQRKLADQAIAHSEGALREAYAKYQAIMDHIGLGIALISPNMMVLEANRQMREWCPNFEVAKQPFCYEVFAKHPRSKPCDHCPTVMALRDGQVHESIGEVLLIDGSRHFRIVSSPIQSAEGAIVAAIQMVEDITDRLVLEDRLRQSQKMEAVGQLAGGMAHDFNNMLQIILGATELAKGFLPPGGDAIYYVNEIRAAAKKSAALVVQLLAFARRQILKPIHLDLSQKIESFIKLLRRTIPENIRIDFKPDSTLNLVHADPVQIDQILLNLCVNSKDAMPAGGQIVIEVENLALDDNYCQDHAWAKPGSYVLLSFSDSGCGIPADNLQQIFEPFFTTKEVGHGTGMGLATVYGIIQQHQGMIHVYSELDKGATFKIYLPSVAKETAQEPEEHFSGDVRGGDETILIVEDDEQLREMVQKMLESVGYKSISAAHGIEALEILSKSHQEIQLVLMDVVMPQMGGKELHKRIMKKWPHLRVVFSSGYTANAIDTGFVLKKGLILLQKPYGRATLLRTIREVLDAKTG